MLQFVTRSVFQASLLLVLASSRFVLAGEPDNGSSRSVAKAVQSSGGLPARSLFEVAEVHNGPVIAKGDPGTQDNKYGLEGGCVLKEKGIYHLFTAEMAGDPKWTKMRLGHWESADGVKWRRVGTLWESSGNFTGSDPRAALWSPMPVYDEKEGCWNLFYVAYRSKPNTDQGWYANYEGRVWRAVSKHLGRDGLSGPYVDVGVVLEPGPECGPWEGLQGTDSFFPYRTEKGWLAFFGSAQTQSLRNTNYPKWAVGLASGAELAGPWKRCNERNPVVMNPVFVENPVVTRLKKGLYVALVDGGPRGRFGYSVSQDGFAWSEATYVDLAKKVRPWWTTMRTPLCLIPEENGLYTVFFTAYTSGDFASMGQVKLRRLANENARTPATP